VSCPKPSAAELETDDVVTLVVPSCSIIVQAFSVLLETVSEAAEPKVRKFTPS
jgi:hypothetical protein